MQKLDLMNVKFIVRKNRETGGLVPIQMQITLEGVRLFFSTGQKIELDYWDVRSGRAVGKSQKIKVINEYLDKMRVDAYKAFNEMKSLGKDVTPEDLRSKLSGKDEIKLKKLLEVCDIFNSNAEKLIGIEIGKITWGRYHAFRNRIADFIKLKYKTDDIYLNQLKYSFMVEYEFYIKTEVKIQQNTMSKYLKYVKRIMDFALNNEWVEKNVFQGYKCPVKEAKREYLTAAELDRIMTKEFTIDRLIEVRDIFVFCCHTGYAYKDAAMLTPEHIGTGINGKKWIYTSRQKTENVANVPLLDIALDILEKYQDHPACVKANKLLPMKSNQKLNSYLKEIADICEIKKPLTTHIARHTFATTVLLANGVSMEATSKMLGHSSIKTTQIYGKIVESRVGDEMDMLSDKLAAKKDDALRKAK
jgi:site-specific recombinase XerD